MRDNFPIIGIVGATGSVGQAVTTCLSAHAHLLIGTRRRNKAEFMRERCPSSEIIEFSLWQKDTLRDFCQSCDVVVNCAGPSCHIFDTVVNAAIEVGTHYVDPGGDEPLHKKLTESLPPKKTFVLSAGMFPGLSALLPLILVGNFDSIDHITAYFGGINRFSVSGAYDYLASLSNGFGHSNMYLRSDQVQPSCLPSGQTFSPLGIEMPFEAITFLPSEFIRLCKRIGIKNADWFNIFFDKHVIDYLKECNHSLDSAKCIKIEAVCGLIKASELDVAGRTPRHILSFLINGVKDNQSVLSAISIEAESGAMLTGAISACAALDLCESKISAGVYYAADILSADRTVDRIRRWLPNVRYRIVQDMRNFFEEGII